MIKNTASQRIGGQMVTAADGTAFTGAVTVAVTVDAGTQATGSVGAGACTHEGAGYHTYAPAQAETNGDLLAFTFTGTGAIPATVQVYTSTGDAFARLGLPAGASVSADIAAVKAETAAIVNDTDVIDDATSGLVKIAADVAAVLVDTAVIGAAGAGLTALATAAALATVDNEIAVIDGIVDSILADTGTDGVVVAAASKSGYALTATTGLGNQTATITGNLSGSVGSVTGAVGSVTGAVGSVTGAVGSVTGAVGSVTGNVGGNVVGSVASVTAGVTVTTNNDKTGYALSAAGIDGVLDETIGDSTVTMRQALKLLAATLGGKLSGAATTTLVIRNVADTANVVSATVDADGNRSAVTLTL